LVGQAFESMSYAGQERHPLRLKAIGQLLASPPA
jgi:hypothetical protein